MKLGIKRGLLLGLAMLGMLAADVAPAGATVTANAGVLVVVGGGTITPALDTIPVQRKSFTFTSLTITGVGTVHKQTITPLDSSTCGAFGNDGIIVPGTKTDVLPAYPGDTPLFGTGLGVWACSGGPLAGKGGLLYYTRVGPIVTVVLTKHAGVGPSKDTPMGALVCGFVPTTVTNTTAYTLACAGAAADQL